MSARGDRIALAVAAALTTWLATLSWRGFTDMAVRFEFPLLFLAAVVAVCGIAGRLAHLSAPLVLLLQVLVSGAALSLVLCGSPLPVGSAWARLDQSLSNAGALAQHYAPPVPAVGDGVFPLLIGGGWICLLLVDFLACSLRRVPLAGLPLLMVYSVPVSMLGGVPWLWFALTSGGFLAMLFLHESERVTRWGRPLGDAAEDDSSGFEVSTGAIKATAGTVGGAAVGLAVVLPFLIPTLDLGLLGFGNGTGPGDGTLDVENPITDLRRDLHRGEDVPVVRFRTDDPHPSYLRIAALTRFSADEWSTGDRKVPSTQQAQGDLPQPNIAASVPRTTYSYSMQVLPDFRSLWLPTQYPLSQIRARGDWRYDTSTMDFLSGQRGTTSAGMTYTFSYDALQLNALQLARSGSSSGLISRDYLQIPTDFPASVRNTAVAVTNDVNTRYEKAVALQDWFRKDGGFTYSLRNAPATGGMDDLVTFLDDKVGYCEQYASAMAAMARVLGIPSRVVVGFLAPDKVAPDTYEYSTYDLHAWPEIFFPGAGWVRFEPTPSDRAGHVPGYTREVVPASPTTGLPSNQPSSDVARPGNDTASQGQGKDKARERKKQAAGGLPVWPFVGGLGGLVVLVAIAMSPRLVRRRRTTRRLTGAPEPAWAEIRDTVLDLRHRWPERRSPRETRDVIAQHLGRPAGPDSPPRPAHGPDVVPEAAEALDRLVVALEELRYARPDEGRPVPGVLDDTRLVIAALWGGASPRERRRATWWPASVLRRPAQLRRETEIAPVSARFGGIVDHVG